MKNLKMRACDYVIVNVSYDWFIKYRYEITEQLITGKE